MRRNFMLLIVFSAVGLAGGLARAGEDAGNSLALEQKITQLKHLLDLQGKQIELYTTQLLVLRKQRGNRGPQGEKGPVGTQGPQGDSGPMGDPGPTGDKGDVGPKGTTGPQGARGPKGSGGAQGAQGEDGPAGSRGPINGCTLEYNSCPSGYSQEGESSPHEINRQGRVVFCCR